MDGNPAGPRFRNAWDFLQSGLTFGESYKEFLGIESKRRFGSAALRPSNPFVSSIGFQDSRLDIVGQVDLQDLLADTVAQQRIANRCQDLDSLVKIAGHPVGTACIDLLLAAVCEIEDATVLEETADNTANTDSIAYAADSRT
jgi:hypothetical protein